MLVIISDLHLSDGTFGNTVAPGAFQMFAGRLADMTRRASWRADGGYRPIERIDLVLLGDVLDMTRSDRWLEADVRPWHDPSSPAVYEAISDITDRILRRNSTSLRILRALASEGAIRIPATGNATQMSNSSIPVPVRIHYMVGNHDWQLHLRGVNYDMVRQKVAHHMGLANSHTEPFAHDPLESDELMESLRRHRVICRHGDIFDPLAYAEDRDLASLNDGLVIELMIRFEQQVRESFGDDLPELIVKGLRAMDKLRPLVLIPVWIEGLMERANPSPHVRRRVKQIWDQLVDEFLALPLVRERDSWSPFDLVDGLESALKFSKRLSVGWMTRTMNWLNDLRGGEGPSYYSRARTEQDFRNRRARHIVYGHTHQAETIPLDASYADQFVLNQIYFNAGTWQRVYSPTVASPGDHEFIPAESLSYLCFFQGDERSGRPYETWSGNLGINPLEDLDSEMGTQSAQHAHSQSLSTAGAPAMGRPHFATDSASRPTPSSHAR